MKRFKFTFLVTLADGKTEEVTITTNLPVSSDAAADVFTAFWNAVAEGGISSFWRFPLYGTVRGFIVTKITEVAADVYEDVPRAEMEVRTDEEVKYRLRADAVMHDGYERRDEYAGAAMAYSPAEAKLKIWRKILEGDAPWCQTASEVESVTFRVQRKRAGRVIFNTPPATIAPSDDGKFKLTAAEERAQAHNGGIDSGKGLINRYRVRDNRKEIYCEGEGCTRYYPEAEFRRSHATHPTSPGNPLV